MIEKYSKLRDAHVKLNITTPCEIRCVKDKWFRAYLRLPALLTLAGQDAHQILGQNLRCVLVNISIEMEQLNLSKSFWSMSGFKRPCSQFTSCINISCFQVAVYSFHLSLLLILPPQCMHFVHRLPAPNLQRLRFRCWSEVLEHLQPWRTQRSATALSALHSPWWLIYSSLQLPCLYCSPRSLLSALWGVRVDFWEYELISIPITFCPSALS